MNWRTLFGLRGSTDVNTDDWSDINSQVDKEERKELAATVDVIRLANEEHLEQIHNTASDLISTHFQDIVVIKLLEHIIEEAETLISVAKASKWSTTITKRITQYADELERVAESTNVRSSAAEHDPHLLDLAQTLENQAKTIRSNIRR